MPRQKQHFISHLSLEFGHFTMSGFRIGAHKCIWNVHHQLLSHFWLFATPQTVAHQALLSMGFSRQEHWSGLPYPPPEDLPDPGIKPVFSCTPALASSFFTASATWEAIWEHISFLLPQSPEWLSLALITRQGQADENLAKKHCNGWGEEHRAWWESSYRKQGSMCFSCVIPD